MNKGAKGFSPEALNIEILKVGSVFFAHLQGPHVFFHPTLTFTWSLLLGLHSTALILTLAPREEPISPYSESRWKSAITGDGRGRDVGGGMDPEQAFPL